MRFCVLLLLLVPALAAAYVESRDPVRPAAASETFMVGRPALVFDQYLVNLRDVEPSRFVTAHFRYVNRSDEPVTITRLKPSCGCMQPRLTKDRLLPGEVGEIFVRVDAALQTPGPHQYEVTMKYDDGQPREQRLIFRATLPDRQVTLRPRSLLMGTTGGAVTQTVTLTDYRLTPLTVKEITSDLPGLTATAGEPTIDADGALQIPIDVTVTQSFDALRDGVVRITTTDETYGEIALPVRVMAMSQLLPPRVSQATGDSSTN